jgi:hypothetical protein
MTSCPLNAELSVFAKRTPTGLPVALCPLVAGVCVRVPVAGILIRCAAGLSIPVVSKSREPARSVPDRA